MPNENKQNENKENEKKYISTQISVYKTDKKLIELNDKLKVAPVSHYAHIHAKGDVDEAGKKLISCIGIILQDYSSGKGQQTKRVFANISPDEADYIFYKLQNGVKEFMFQQDKIFGKEDEQGRAIVTKLKIIRASQGKDGQPRRYPWYVEIGNGTGIKVKRENGGIYMQSNSYQEKQKVYINLNDLDFFLLFSRVHKYIQAWEAVVGPQIIIEGKQALAESIMIG